MVSIRNGLQMPPRKRGKCFRSHGNTNGSRVPLRTPLRNLYGHLCVLLCDTFTDPPKSYILGKKNEKQSHVNPSHKNTMIAEAVPISEALTAVLKQYVNSEFDLTLAVAKRALVASTAVNRE